jgi:hypothetical protein
MEDLRQYYERETEAEKTRYKAPIKRSSTITQKDVPDMCSPGGSPTVCGQHFSHFDSLPAGGKKINSILECKRWREFRIKPIHSTGDC